MPRKPEVRYFPSRNAFFCQVGGRQHRLGDGPDDRPSGPRYAAALRAFIALWEANETGAPEGDAKLGPILAAFLAHLKTTKAPATYKTRRAYLRPFAEQLGECVVAGLTVAVVQQFLDAQRLERPARRGKGVTRWTDGGVRGAITSLRAALRWAVRVGHLASDPLGGLELPRQRSRGRETIVNDFQHAAALAAAHPRLREILVALENSGARPSEILAATASAWHDQAGALVYHADERRLLGEHRHKTAGADKDRVILFTGDALAMMRALVAKHPTGPLFRSQRAGRKWHGCVLCDHFCALRPVIGHRAYTPYSYRHTFATRWLERGGSVDDLADLLGNTPEVCRKHYKHLLTDRAGLRARLENLRGGQTLTDTPAPPSPGGA